MSRYKSILTGLGIVIGFAPGAQAQVAFFPQVSSFPNGVTLGVTPVVSYDRRYVRMTVNPQFTALEGFDTFSVPGAVSGVGAGGGGFRSVVPGQTFVAGMDGVAPADPNGYAWAGGYQPSDSAWLSGEGGPPAQTRLTPGPGTKPQSRAMRSTARTRKTKPSRKR